MSYCHSCSCLAVAVIGAVGVVGGPHEAAGTQPASGVNSSTTIASGSLYAYGHRITPPYELVVHEGILAVNGVQVFPPLRLPAVRDLDISESARQRHELRERLFALQAELERAGETTAEIAARWIEHLRAESALVDSVTGVSDDDFWIWWRGERQPEQFLVWAPRSVPTPNARAEEERNLLFHALERDCLVIVAPNRRLIIPPDPPERIAEILEEIERAREAGASELTPERWSGRHLDCRLARLFQHPLALPVEE